MGFRGGGVWMGLVGRRRCLPASNVGRLHVGKEAEEDTEGARAGDGSSSALADVRRQGR
ncbi:protein of unknown function (plasmid) [Caballeronia sp. S22]